MPWNYNDAEINGIIDGSLKDAPPAAPMSNTAGTVRALLKNMWLAMRGQVSQAVASIDATNANFVARSLNLGAAIYVDGVNGDDSRLGTTNDNNAITGRIKTLARVGQLHNGKTFNLTVHIVSAVDVTEDINLDVPYLHISISAAPSALTFKKRVIYNGAVLSGEGNYRLVCQSVGVTITVAYGGTLVVEAHGGRTGSGDPWSYNLAQGAIALRGYTVRGNVAADAPTLSIWQIDGHITIGDNATLAYPGGNGANYLTLPAARYARSRYSGNFTLGANAVESRMIADRVFNRQYHPTSSTDANVMEGETVVSPTNNKLWTKRAGTIRDAMGTTFV
jgi:hypothetical protein